MTAPIPQSRTLLEDWQLRRAQLAKVLEDPATTEAHARDYAGTQIRLLDYLIERYAGKAEGLKPAAFPLSKSSTMFMVRQHMIMSKQKFDSLMKSMGPEERSAWNWKYEAYSQLDNSNPEERLAGIQRLAFCGDLDDIGLFSNILQLPPNPGEDPRERSKLIWAIQSISNRCAEYRWVFVGTEKK